MTAALIAIAAAAASVVATFVIARLLGWASAGEHDDPPVPTSSTGDTAMLIRYREPALTATTLLAPAVGLVLLFFADLSPAAQAGWNGLAVAVAGLVTSAIAVRERLAPTILGFAQAVLGLLSVYGWGLSAEQTTGLMGFLALALGIYVRGQITAPPERGPIVVDSPAIAEGVPARRS